MSFSIRTNVAAIAAVRQDSLLRQEMNTTAAMVATGLRVRTARDDAALWSSSVQMNTQVADLGAVQNNLSLTSGALAVAQQGATQAASLISQIRTKVTAAQQQGADQTALQQDITSLMAQLQSTIQGSSFQGVNYLTGTGADQTLATSVQAGRPEQTIGIAHQNLGFGAGGQLAGLSGLNLLSGPATPAVPPAGITEDTSLSMFAGVVVSDVKVDDQGNKYVLGQAVIDFPSFENAVSLTKYDPSGKMLWTVTPGTAAGTGMNSGKLVLDGSGGVTLTAQSDVTGFNGGVIANYSANGTLNWADSISGQIQLNGLARDSSGNYYAVGQSKTDVANGGTSDLQLVKFNSTGSVLWSKTVGPSGNNVAGSIAMDSAGNVILSGTTSGTTHQSFVGSFDASGHQNWGKLVGNATNSTSIKGVAADANGHIYLGISSDVPSPGTPNAILMQMDLTGSVNWQKSIAGNEYVGGLAVDSNQNAVIGGDLIAPGGGFDSYIGTFSQTGTPVSQRILANPDDTLVQALATGPNGMIVASVLDDTMAANNILAGLPAATALGTYGTFTYADRTPAVTNVSVPVTTSVNPVSATVTTATSATLHPWVTPIASSTVTPVSPGSLATSGQPDYASLLHTIDQAEHAVTTAAGAIGDMQQRVSDESQFNSGLIASLGQGRAGLVDADLGVEAVRLAALRTQQDLTTQTMAIANAMPSIILGMFKPLAPS